MKSTSIVLFRFNINLADGDQRAKRLGQVVTFSLPGISAVAALGAFLLRSSPQKLGQPHNCECLCSR